MSNSMQNQRRRINQLNVPLHPGKQKVNSIGVDSMSPPQSLVLQQDGDVVIDEEETVQNKMCIDQGMKTISHKEQRIQRPRVGVAGPLDKGTKNLIYRPKANGPKPRITRVHKPMNQQSRGSTRGGA